MKTKLFAVAAAAALLAGAGHVTTAQAAMPTLAASAAPTEAPDGLVLAGFCFGLHCVIKDKEVPTCTHRYQRNCKHVCPKHVDHRKRPKHVDHRGQGKSAEERENAKKWDPRNKRGRDEDRKRTRHADNGDGPKHVDHRKPGKIKHVDHRKCQ